MIEVTDHWKHRLQRFQQPLYSDTEQAVLFYCVAIPVAIGLLFSLPFC